MAAFPAYMKPLIRGFAKSPNMVISRTEMEDGMTKQAKTKARALVVRPIAYLVRSLADFQAWETFFNTTINGGADWFDWVDPIDGLTKTARIVNGKYTASPLNGLVTDWEVSMEIETWNV